MKAFLVLALVLAVSQSSRLPIPYEVYVKHGGLPLPEALRTGKWYDPQKESDTYIVGGTAATAGEFPYIVSLQTSSHFCGGSILNARTIITAAHCVDGRTASSLRVRVGSNAHASGGTLVSISAIRQHASYSASTIDYDIALLITATDIPLGGSVGTVSLPSAEPAANAAVNVAGWGTLTSGGSSLPAQLQRVTVNIVARATCQSNYGSSSVTARMICAGVTGGGKDSCQGDSGGPLTVGNTLYGVVSWGRGCAQAGYPGVYTNVAALTSWITSNQG